MGFVKHHPPCLQIIAAFSKYDSALDWLWERVAGQLSPIAMISPAFPFTESHYYRSTMGDQLKKQFAILSNWYDPAELSTHKLMSHVWESELVKNISFDVERPLNIDPGYMSMTKLVLASTKNREHRVYLRDGVYAEVTLAFRDQQWRSLPWTYPDYQRDDFRVFFHEGRKHLAKSVASTLRNREVSPFKVMDSEQE